MIRPTLLIVPGLRDHVAGHWQTHLAAQWPGARTVEPITIDRFSRAARVAALDDALAAIDGPVVIAAHSAGCMITVHWAATSPRRAVVGALLATPADLERPMPPGYPALDLLERNGWLPIPRLRLPFPSLVAASTDDPLAGFDRVSAFAERWGSRLVDLGAVGHLNPASGFGEWPAAMTLVERLCEGSQAG